MEFLSPCTIHPLSGGLGAVIQNAAQASPRNIGALGARYGALLMPAYFPDRESFRRWSNGMSRTFRPYRGGAVRRSTEGDDTVFLSSEPGEQDGSTFHGEQYYMPDPPRWLWFFCEAPAPAGGETLVCDGVRLLEALPEDLRSALLSKQIMYRRDFSAKAWRSIFGDCPQLPSRWVVDVRHDGWVYTSFTCNPTVIAPSGRPAFVNSILPIFKDFAEGPGLDEQRMSVVWSNGEPLSQRAVESVLRTADDLATSIKLGPGDVLLVDNAWVLHGRRRFSGPRKVWIRMASDLCEG